MSYRRTNKVTTELRNYKTFCQNNSTLIGQIGLPSILVEDHDSFIYFLMHGALPPDTSTGFNLEDFDYEKRKMYLRLLSKYFEAGFSDPGLLGLTLSELDKLRK